MCDSVFTLQTLLYRYFDQHIKNQKVSVFKRPDCSLLYAQKQLMRDHIKSMHGTLKSIKRPPNLGINLPLSSKPATQNSANQNEEDTWSTNGKEELEKKSPSPVKKNHWNPRTRPVLGGHVGGVAWLFTHRYLHFPREEGTQEVTSECLPVGVRKIFQAMGACLVLLGIRRVTSKITQLSQSLSFLVYKMGFPSPSNLLLWFCWWPQGQQGVIYCTCVYSQRNRGPR